MGISLLPGQLIDQLRDYNRKHQHNKYGNTARRHFLERLVMGQLAKTHVTHPKFPNFHGIRQYQVLIIPFSAKLNVIPHRYITQHDTRFPSQQPHSWMEEQLKRNL